VGENTLDSINRVGCITHEGKDMGWRPDSGCRLISRSVVVGMTAISHMSPRS
jgi:hypothetical protein